MKACALPLLTVVLLFASALPGCALLKSNPPIPAVVGMWDMMVMQTPQGDLPASLSVLYAEGAFTGEFGVESLMQRVPITEVSFEGETFLFSATLDIEGQPTKVTATTTVDGDSFEGPMAVPGFGDFTVTGARKVME